MKKIFTYFLCFSALGLSFSCGTSNGGANSENPFFAEKWGTPFEIPAFAKIKNEHFLPAYEEGIRLKQAEIDALVANTEEPTFENTIAAYVDCGAFLDRVASAFGSLTSANVTDTLRQLQSQIMPMLTKQSNEISLNAGLFERIKNVYDKRESLGLSAEQLRLTEKIYQNFAKNGANLPEESKTELKEINQQLSALSLKFGNNLLSDMNSFKLEITDQADLAGLPEAVIAGAKVEGEDKWIFTLDKPSMLPFLQYADNRDLRQKLYEGYLNRCNYDNETDNKAVIDSIVNLRVERANILGYDSHASYILETNMAKNAENVYALLDELWTPALKRAKAELKDMKAIKVKHTGSSEFASWDWWYYAERLRAEKYNLNEDEIKPYFSLEATRTGIFTLCDKLYGISFKPVEGAVLYSDECQMYECFDNDGKHLGALMMDFHPRPGKRVGAWCSGFIRQSYKDGKRVDPVSIIVCNFTRPVGDMPALLSLDEVETFFHEFGHALHSLLSDVKTNGLNGVTRDFVELPSQIMENWALSAELLPLYAKHYETGEVIPEELITKIGNSSLFNQGFNTVEYLAAALLDMKYHSITEVKPIDIAKFEADFLKEYGAMDEIAPRYRTTYYSHIFNSGYSAGYYAYIWAEVLDADAYQAFVETGDVFNKEVAEKFRRNVLQQGGTQDEADLYRSFRGKDADKSALLKNRGLM
ncbi:MAG: M3 family metallopeptidase [Rikenellaceae bacterium]